MVDFEYRIDRRPRVLRRADLFANPYRPKHKLPNKNFWMSNALFSSALRVAVGTVAPRFVREPLNFPNEHLLVHLSGPLEYRIEGKTYLAAKHDQLFVPAFVDYQIVNVGDEEGRFYSGALRVGEWDRPVEREAVEPQFRHHAYKARPELRRDSKQDKAAEFSDAWWVSEELAATNTRSSIVILGPGAEAAPSHHFNEHVFANLSGRTSWRVDGMPIELTAEDLLFVPAWIPFSYRNPGDVPASVLKCEVRLEGWEPEPEGG
jgi:mannose-6-phosphate isomerase-like protein (cupin superfamily)